MTVRAKFKLMEMTSFAGTFAQKLKFQAVTADAVPENQRFHRYTPSGSLELMVDNPPAQDYFSVGQDYYLDFTNVQPMLVAKEDAINVERAAAA